MTRDKALATEEELRKKITDIVENYAEAMQTETEQYPEFIAVDNILKIAKPYYTERGRQIEKVGWIKAAMSAGMLLAEPSDLIKTVSQRQS